MMLSTTRWESVVRRLSACPGLLSPRGHSRTATALRIASLAMLLSAPIPGMAIAPPATELPAAIDVRGAEGVPRGLEQLQPTSAQLKALARLEFKVGAPLNVEYNGLTATPRYLFSDGNYLTPPSSASAERIARDFLQANRGLFRFSDADLQGLRLRSRATLPDAGSTILVLQQHLGDIPVHQGEVLFTISENGQIISVGNDNFPRLQASNVWRIAPQTAITIAAAGLGMPGLFPHPIGDKEILRTYGDLPAEFTATPVFFGGDLFGGEIAVSRVAFPMGDTAQYAYEFTLETPQLYGMMWQIVVDAETGQILRRLSLTSFQQGGGVGVGRRASFRPDVQDMVEAMNPDRTAQAKVFDTYPTMLSGRLGSGRSTRSGTAPDYTYTQPIYAAETQTVQNSGRGFKYSQLTGRHESGVPFANTTPAETFPHTSLPGKLGEVNRGFPDAENPSKGSRFGWFYLPTDNGGAEIAAGNTNRAATQAFGYTMATEAKNRNVAANSPGGDGAQPYSSTLTTLPGPIALADGRSMTAVIQSNYTEGNNTLVADDRANDNESTHGIRGYHATRQFVAPHFDFVNSYEYGGVNAASGTFPASTNPDVFPATTSLFFLNNILHDYLYEIGFTESLWNFQQDNFGLGGASNDAVSVQAMDGSGINNANFGTPADGSRPRMQMFLWTEDATRRADGNFDFDVVAHELYHGVSNRSAAKGSTGCMGLTAVGEAGGQGEGLGDFLANSMADDDTTGEYVTGELDRGIRRLPYTNFRWSYESINQRGLTRRDRQLPPDITTSVGTGSVPFAVHVTGELWGATLWDVRELFVLSEPGGVFYDGSRRLGSGTSFYVGPRQVQSVDSLHPIDYRASYRTTHDPVTGLDGTAPNIGAAHFIRPGLVAAEIQSRGNRTGPLATAVARAGRKIDTLVLRALQIGPCNSSFVESRNSMLLADREIYGGEDRAMIWRAFASHGVGAQAASSGGSGGDQGSQSAPVVVEDFTVPAGVAQCEQLGPLPNPAFALTNTKPNTATITINGGTPVAGASSYLISRSASADGPFRNIASVPAATTTFDDDDAGVGLPLNGTFYYKVRAARDTDGNCMSASSVQSVTITVGIVLPVSPSFAGLEQVSNPQVCERLVLSWKAATSTSPSANLVYDVFRTPSVTPGDGTLEPTFTPAAGLIPTTPATGRSDSMRPPRRVLARRCLRWRTMKRRRPITDSPRHFKTRPPAIRRWPPGNACRA